MTVINIFTLWQMMMSECNVQQGGAIRPTIDFQNWLNTVNVELFRDKIARYQASQMGADELSPFLKTINVALISGTPSYDIMPYPSDYEYYVNTRILRQKDTNVCACLLKDDNGNDVPILTAQGTVQYIDPDYQVMAQQAAQNNLTERLVYIVDNNKWESCLNHPTKGATFQEPKGTQFKQGLKIAPKGMQNVILDYFSTPVNAVFAYTVTDDIPIYNASGSTQLQWSEALTRQFLDYLKPLYYASVGDEQNLQLSLKIKEDSKKIN